MIITLKNQSGCSFIFNDIPELDTSDKVKEYLLKDPTTSHLFKSREDLDQNWEVTSHKQQATCPQASKGCKPHGWPKGNPKWTKQQATSNDK